MVIRPDQRHGDVDVSGPGLRKRDWKRECRGLEALHGGEDFAYFLEKVPDLSSGSGSEMRKRVVHRTQQPLRHRRGRLAFRGRDVRSNHR